VKFEGRNRFYIILAAISLAGFLLRIFSLLGKDLCFWDEGIFLMGCRFLRWRIANAWLELLNFAVFQFSIPPAEMYDGYPVFLQKPFHVVLLTVTSFFTGASKSAGYLHSAFYGALTIFATGALARNVRNHFAGYAAALFLAFEP
jgi:hypothetical protein